MAPTGPTSLRSRRIIVAHAVRPRKLRTRSHLDSRRIHANRCGYGALALLPERGPGQCFAGAERHDLLWQGRKIAGASATPEQAGPLDPGLDPAAAAIPGQGGLAEGHARRGRGAVGDRVEGSPNHCRARATRQGAGPSQVLPARIQRAPIACPAGSDGSRCLTECPTGVRGSLTAPNAGTARVGRSRKSFSTSNRLPSRSVVTERTLLTLGDAISGRTIRHRPAAACRWHPRSFQRWMMPPGFHVPDRLPGECSPMK